ATPESFTGPVNLGNPHEVTMRELAASIIRLTNSRSRLTLLPLPQDDPKRRCPDIGLAKRELGWEPRTPFEEGLAATIAHFKKEGRD
ncbi:MAG TPA: SDR family NAD-dependent epimerase/dehydratase, partial [bacterium]|nr:SDR family NAD-dependent epimerase/dehydratase [bacterium]